MSQSGGAIAAPQSPDSHRVLTPSYLEKHKNKKDLVRRLSTVASVLHLEDVEADLSEYPGLAALSTCLVQNFLEHKDKEVRLYTVVCCMELFAVYAPEAPWSESEVMTIFHHTIQQLANLPHTTSSSQPHYKSYFRILELLATVNIGVVLVELAKEAGDDPEHSSDNSESPVELLAQLFETTLTSLRPQHSPQVSDYTLKCLTGCLEEYNDGMMVPIPVLDQILICLGKGPTITTPVPPKPQDTIKGGKRQKPPPLQTMEQTNPNYIVAATMLRKLTGKFHNDVSSLLNGIINNEAHIIEKSSIGGAQEDDDQEGLNESGVDVWQIVFELNRVAPAILTTVIGTISCCLESPETTKRQKVAHLLGRLFYAKKSQLATKFSPCFRKWLGRVADCDSTIRSAMVHALASIIHSNSDKEVIFQSENALMVLLGDKKVEIRRQAIDAVCELAFEEENGGSISASLFQAVGERVKSKDKQERIEAITGPVKSYFHKFMAKKLRDIQNAGDDCEIDLILTVLSENCNFTGLFSKTDKTALDSNNADKEKYRWIPKRLAECLFYTDAFDSEMRSRVIQLFDEYILGCSHSKNRKLSPTARAVGLAIVLDSIREHGDSIWGDKGSHRNNYFLHMSNFLRQRATLQKAISNYIDARTRIRECQAGTEEAYTAEARAMDKLKVVASLVPPPTGDTLANVLECFHKARDKHIFRILASICDPRHGVAARCRAVDDLPKRFSSHGDAVMSWVKTLAKRCTMGDFLNAENIQHCILLAQESYNQGDISCCVALLSCVKFAVSIFPSICNDTQSFATLSELFSEVQNVSSGRGKKSKEEKKLIEDSGIVTGLSSILSVVSPTLKGAKIVEESRQEKQSSGDLQKQLLHLIRGGTPEQARRSVETFVTLFKASNKESDTYTPLIKELLAASKLTISGSGEKNVSTLTALAAFVEGAPKEFCASKKSELALRFALETILMGRGASDGAETSDSEDSNIDSDMEDGDDDATKKTPKRKSTSSRSKRSSVQHKSPTAGISILENEDLSLSCRRVCAAIEFLVSYIRSAVLTSLSGNAGASIRPAEDRIKAVFGLLLDVIRDRGMPPSNRDRSECRSRNDRAAIRQVAIVQLLRLCDSRLKLEHLYLSHADFHILAGGFLDEEKVVREAAMDELSHLFLGDGVYKEKGKPQSPKLRFVSLVSLCCDENASGHSRANGGAANVGKKSANLKLAALKCIRNMRRACDATYAQLQATMGQQQAHQRFEQLKLSYMPEFAVPYLYNMLAFRRETPTAEAQKDGKKRSRDSEERDKSKSFEDAQHKMLVRRLKWFFEPLIQSLGDSADNISFLLSMTSALSVLTPISANSGGSFSPKKVSTPSHRESLDTTISTPGSVEEPETSVEAEAKLAIVCSVAREVLLSFVKKDSHLAEHPEAARIPQFLFQKKHAEKKGGPAAESVTKGLTAPGTIESARFSRSVTFSPALPSVSHGASLKSPLALGVSPIQPQSSGRKSRGSEQETKTLSPGDTPLSTMSKATRTTPARKILKQPMFSPSSPESDSDSRLPNEDGPDDHVQTTAETQSTLCGGSAQSHEKEEVTKTPEPKKKRKKSSVPSQIKIGRNIECDGKENDDVFSYEDQGEELPRKKVGTKKRKSSNDTEKPKRKSGRVLRSRG